MNQEEKIRKRQSYKVFKQFLGTLKDENTQPLDILKLFYREIDNRRGFGSRTNSLFALESIELIEAEEKGVTK